MKSKLWVYFTLILAVGVWGIALPGIATAGKVTSRVEIKDGKTYVTIANPFIELTFEPGRGGRCTGFRFLDNGEEIIGHSKYSGMFIDHWAKYSWPSGLMWLPYQYRIVGDGKTKVGIRLWIKVPEKGGGKGATTPAASLKIPTSPDLIGLIVQKTIWLNADNDVIVVEEEIKNPTQESRSVAPYIQHNLNMGGSRYYDNWYMPSTSGIVVRVEPDKEGGKVIGPDWVLDPVAGWIAVNDRQSKRGMLFVFDYNYLEKIYTCGLTAEWFMESVPIGPGKSFKFNYIIKPIKGFEDIVHASKNIVADIRPDEKGNRIQVAFDIAAVSKKLSGVTADFRIVGWKNKKEIDRKSMKIGKLGFNKIRREFSFRRPKNLTDGVVIKAIVRGDGFEDRFEYYYAGDKEEYDRRYNPFSTRGMALAGSRGGAYFRRQPRKHKIFDKPDFSKIAPPSPDRFKVLVVFGLYTQILNIDDALAGWKYKGNKPQFTWANCPPNAIETFPGTYDELFSYNTVVLSDANYKAIGDIGFEMICDYVEQGGSLLVTGGPYAFGNGEFEGTRFLEVLPVKLWGPFDLKWAGKNKSWTLKPVNPSSPVLKGVSFRQDPRVFWEHFVTPKRGAEVILEAGGHPVLILGRYGKGKVAVLTLSPTGEARAGEVAWWDWDGWSPLMKNIFTWLNE